MNNQEAIKRRYTFGNDEFSLEAAYHDCKLIFDGITDDDSFQEADTGLILYYANEIIYALHEALEGKDTKSSAHPDCADCKKHGGDWECDYNTCHKGMDAISRQAAIDALWKALYEYEDKAEKQFQESKDLDVGDWIGHRIFVQNMNDIDRQTILDLPSIQPELIKINIDHELTKDEYEKLRKDLADAPIVLQSSAQPEQRWILCSEGLPDEGQKGICLYSNGKISGGEYMGNRLWDVDYADHDVTTIVKAWMPAPES